MSFPLDDGTRLIPQAESKAGASVLGNEQQECGPRFGMACLMQSQRSWLLVEMVSCCSWFELWGRGDGSSAPIPWWESGTK